MLANKISLSIFLFSLLICFSDNKNTDVIKYCDEISNGRRLLLVSTLNGKLTALNIDEGGSEKWNMPTEPGPLLSSNIHHVELEENSQLVRIVPSLSGELYKFDGESIELMPVNTDTLLKSHWDNIDISGGKEISTYAIHVETGQIVYECSMHKCSNGSEDEHLNIDTILLRRETQKVRAIEMSSRTERWNYSVGLHNVTVRQNGNLKCSKKEQEFVIRAIVAKGLLYLVRKSNPDKIFWKHQFDSPIVNAWTLLGDRLDPVDLFEPIGVAQKNIYPIIYIGIHNDQLYIQESHPFHHSELLLEKTRFSTRKYRVIHALDANYYKQSVVPLITDQSRRNSTTALAMLYGSEIVNDGHYLYCADSKTGCESKKGKLPFLASILAYSFLYWKEAIVLLSVTFCLIHYAMPYPNPVINRISDIGRTIISRIPHIGRTISAKFYKKHEHVTEINEEAPSSVTDSGISIIYSTQCETGDYKSRYLEDFEPVHCLGKGGFGVVFQAKHKLTDCHYAIKRITLPDRKDARERVLREVKALANMEHQHIVRYFQSWEESPPYGWQEKQDKLWKNKTKEEYLSSEMSSSEMSSSSHMIRQSQNTLSDITTPKWKATHENDSLDIVFENSEQPEDNKIEHAECTTQSELVKRNEHEDQTNARQKEIHKKTRVYLYIQMQLCQKHSLREWLCDNLDRNQNTILNMFDQIVQAVEYVHLQGLIHRDLKPSNIFFSPDGQIKVGDFGLVTEISENSDLITENKKHSVKSTRRHTANVGTELYMSPEQVLGNQYTYKVDIYSLGIILFELLIPFHTQMERHKTLINLRNNKFPRDFPTKYEHEYNLLQMMLASKPDDRPTTFGIRARPPLNSYHVSDVPPIEWHYDLPAKSTISANILRKSSAS